RPGAFERCLAPRGGIEMNRMPAWATTACLALLLLAGCGGTEPAKQSAPPPEHTLRVIYQNEPAGLVSGLSPGTTTIMISRQIHDTLVIHDANGNVVPHMAESWQVADDGRRYEFRLRPDIRWHDGVPFTSEDVAFSMLHFWKTIGVGAGPIPGFERVREARTPDPRTVIFELSRPVSPELFLQNLVMCEVIARDIYVWRDQHVGPVNAAPVGTGPFVFARLVGGQYIVLHRNPHSWGRPAPALDRIIIRYNADPVSRAAILEAGEADLGVRSPVPLTDLERFERLPQFVVSTDGYQLEGWQLVMEMNLRRPITGDARVRRAIRHAIARDFITHAALIGYGRPSTGPIRSDSPFYTPEVPKYPFDPARAAALLDEAGYPRKRDGVRFRHDFLVPPTYHWMVQAGEIIRQQLADVGVGVRVIHLDASTHVKRIYTDYDFDMTLNPTVARADPLISTTHWFTTEGIVKGVSFRNASGYSNPELDDIVERAKEEIDPVQRK